MARIDHAEQFQQPRDSLLRAAPTVAGSKAAAAKVKSPKAGGAGELAGSVSLRLGLGVQGGSAGRLGIGVQGGAARLGLGVQGGGVRKRATGLSGPSLLQRAMGGAGLAIKCALPGSPYTVEFITTFTHLQALCVYLLRNFFHAGYVIISTVPFEHSSLYGKKALPGRIMWL